MKLINKKTILTIAAMLLLNSSYGVSHPTSIYHCVKSNAYAAGLKDARSHKKLNHHYGQHCFPNAKKIYKSYCSGYHQATLAYNAHHNNKWKAKKSAAPPVKTEVKIKALPGN